MEITIVNVDSSPSDDPPFYIRYGDACNLSEFPDNSFTIVHSNSVIEHVGHWSQMSAMAGEVRRLAPHYFVQTPNFWFPYEPHYRRLFMHWYPESLRAARILRRPQGFMVADTYAEAMTEVQNINLLTKRQMTELFPDAVLRRERIGPFTKSLIAIR